ncbi:BlaI/MecI/CopY family transcriptional regulator [Kitasatospora sp. NPDC059088]|uniref:BlaI/MecI/CopY family transcriptional regulator n=1 Tax=Kitasatospora sp. NPDC059088 TaxID=3346722 RepID=UPI00367A831E
MSDVPSARRPAGELESEVLAALWSARQPMTPQDVQTALGGDLARTTIATILARLHDKGTVERTRAGRAYAYTPTVQDTAGLAARRMHTELGREADRSTVLARFVSDLSAEDEQLLRALLGDGSDVGVEAEVDGTAGAAGAGGRPGPVSGPRPTGGPGSAGAP